MLDESEPVLVLPPQVRENIPEDIPGPENFGFQAPEGHQVAIEPPAQPREWQDEFEMVPAAVSQHYKEFLNLKEFYRVDRYKPDSPYDMKDRKKEDEDV